MHTCTYANKHTRALKIKCAKHVSARMDTLTAFAVLMLNLHSQATHKYIYIYICMIVLLLLPFYESVTKEHACT